MVVSRFAKEYMKKVILETRGSDAQDLEVVATMLKIKV